MENFDRAVESIDTRGWLALPDFIEPETVTALREECLALAASGMFRSAAVGNGASRRMRPDVRSDEILWLDAGQGCEGRRNCLDRFEQLRLALNRQLQLGLFEFECHYARYAPGAHYRKHFDRFQGDARRILSSVLYLNAGWNDGDGGELRLYLEDAGHIDVPPAGGTLVLFLSERFAHEVLPARRERLSLTGWYRARD